MTTSYQLTHSHDNLEGFEVIDWRKNVKKIANVWKNYANS